MRIIGIVKFYRPKGAIGGLSMADPGEGAVVVEAGEQWIPRSQQIHEHRNRGWEIYFQPKGRSLWACGRKRFEVASGGYYLLAPGISHRLVGLADEETHFYFAVLSVDAVGEDGRNWPRPFVAGHAGDALDLPFRGLMRELAMDRDDRAAGMACYAAALCLEINRLLRGPVSRPAARHYHPASERALAVIDSSPGRPWKLDELAAIAGVSVAHFIEVFREAVGQSPHQYLLRRRMEIARQLLATTDRPITEISIDLGFSSSQHFATAFRKAHGTSPRSARKSGSLKGPAPR